MAEEKKGVRKGRLIRSTSEEVLKVKSSKESLYKMFSFPAEEEKTKGADKPILSHNSDDRLELLESVHKDFCGTLTTLMSDFVATVQKLLPPRPGDSRHTGEGVVFHVERKWGIVDLGNHDHVFFDLSILLGSVDDLRTHFQVGERLAFEAVKASKPSRANWKATSVWKLSKPNPFTLSPNNSSHSNPFKQARHSIHSTQPINISTMRHSFSHDKLSSKYGVPASCDNTPLLSNWRSKRSTSPLSSTLSNPFRQLKTSEPRNYSSSVNPSSFRLAPHQQNPLLPTFSEILSNKFKLSPCKSLSPSHLYQANLPTLDDAVVDEFHSRRHFKKLQEQLKHQLEKHQQQRKRRITNLNGWKESCENDSGGEGSCEDNRVSDRGEDDGVGEPGGDGESGEEGRSGVSMKVGGEDLNNNISNCCDKNQTSDNDEYQDVGDGGMMGDEGGDDGWKMGDDGGDDAKIKSGNGRDLKKEKD